MRDGGHKKKFRGVRRTSKCLLQAVRFSYGRTSETVSQAEAQPQLKKRRDGARRKTRLEANLLLQT